MKSSTFALLVAFVAAVAVASPITQPPIPPDFTEVEKTTITGLLEKHKLRDIIKVLFMLEKRRFTKEPTTRPPRRMEALQMGSLHKPELSIFDDSSFSKMKTVDANEGTQPPAIPFHDFYDEEPWRHGFE